MALQGWVPIDAGMRGSRIPTGALNRLFWESVIGNPRGVIVGWGSLGRVLQ